jgi:WD40 repeat protein
MACDLSGQPIWPQEFFTYGVFTFSPDSRYLINFGFMDYDPSQSAGLLLSQGSGDPGALINTETGALRVLWNDPNHDSYDLQVRPQISPDGCFISFNTISSEGTFLHVIDLRGKPLLELPDAMVLDWKTGGELAVVSQVSQQEKRLDLYQISGNQPTHILPAAAVWITDAAWSQDGARLAITTYDQAAEVGTVYVWSSSDQKLNQVAQHDIAQQPSCIEWMTEDQGFYYTLGAHEGCQANSSLWQYLDETGQSRLVAQIALP